MKYIFQGRNTYFSSSKVALIIAYIPTNNTGRPEKKDEKELICLTLNAIKPVKRESCLKRKTYIVPTERIPNNYLCLQHRNLTKMEFFRLLAILFSQVLLC